MPLLTDVSVGDVVELSLTNGDRDVAGIIDTVTDQVEGYIIDLEPVTSDADPVFVPKDDLHLRITAKRVTFLTSEVVKVRHFGGLNGFASYDLDPELPDDVASKARDLIDGDAA